MLKISQVNLCISTEKTPEDFSETIKCIQFVESQIIYWGAQLCAPTIELLVTNSNYQGKSTLILCIYARLRNQILKSCVLGNCMKIRAILGKSTILVGADLNCLL